MRHRVSVPGWLGWTWAPLEEYFRVGSCKQVEPEAQAIVPQLYAISIKPLARLGSLLIVFELGAKGN